MMIEGDPRREIESIARGRIDLSIAPTSPVESSGRASNAATRRYLEGRAAIAGGRPDEAIEPLREAHRLGGGAAALHALADAFDRTGRWVEATEVRRELARLGGIGEEDRARLVDGLRRRREVEAAVAVQSASVVTTIDQAGLATEACRLAELLDATTASDDARRLRAAVASLLESDDHDLRGLDPSAVQRFWVGVGDDAARCRALSIAADRWRRAADGDGGDPAIRGRRLRVAAALGRDLTVQALLLDAAEAPTEADLELASSLRQADVSFDRLATALEARILEEGAASGSWRLLITVAPERGAAVLDRLATSDREAVAGPLVTAAFEGGPSAAIDVARTMGGSIDGADAAVDALLEGPADAEALLRAAMESESTRPGSPVVVELLRRHDRLDLAADVLDATTIDDAVSRILRLRLAGDSFDPGIIFAVPTSPFDGSVEQARVEAVLAAGEPELAATLADALLERGGEDPDALMVAARVAALRRGGAAEAVELAARARRAGDERTSTALELARFAAALPDGASLLPTTRRTLATLADDPVLRAIIDADTAIASGDPASVVERLEPLLADVAAREVVMPRLLAAWRTAGRLAEGRLRLSRLLERHPADPVLADALFAVDRALSGPRAVAEGQRPAADQTLSGLPLRRLEIVLAEIPECRDERRAVSSLRLSRRLDGPGRDIERLALAIEASGGSFDPSFDAALAGVESIDLASLAPRQRRRLASILAVVPDRRGAPAIARIADGVERDGDTLDVDTAVAIASTLGVEDATVRFARLRPAPPWTILDAAWRARAASLVARDVEAADLIARFGLTRPPEDETRGGDLRTAVAIAMLAGRDLVTILDLVDRAAAIGWDATIAWPDGDPADLRRLSAIASDASMLGRDDLGIELMELAVESSPDDPVGLNNLGYALLDLGELDRAGELLDASRRIDPDSASTLDSMGWLRFLQGRHDPADPESAISLVRRSIAIRLDEGRMPSAEVLMHLADATWAAGDRVEAERLWRSLAAPVAEATRRRRQAGIRTYQTDIWGAELVPSADIDRMLEGRWTEAARARIAAIEAGEDPIGGR